MWQLHDGLNRTRFRIRVTKSSHQFVLVTLGLAIGTATPAIAADATTSTFQGRIIEFRINGCNDHLIRFEGNFFIVSHIRTQTLADGSTVFIDHTR